MENPIIILGSERSGTNLLRHLLSNHQRISGPVSPHFLEVFSNHCKYYGDLRKIENLKVLYMDMVRLSNHPFHDWNLNCDFLEFYNRYTPDNIIQLFHSLYLSKAELEGKKRYVSKDISAWRHALKIKSLYPETRFIHLVRDPRDHVRSWMKRPIYILTPLDAIKKWKSDQEEIRDLSFSFGLNVHLVKYEDLIEDTPKVMTYLLHFLDESIDERCFQTSTENAKESKWNDYWKNLGEKIIRDNRGKYKDGLDSEDINLIETLCHEEMQYFGYEMVSPCDWKPSYRYSLGLIKKKRESLRKRRMASETWKKIFYSKQNEIEKIKSTACKRWVDRHREIKTKLYPFEYLKAHSNRLINSLLSR
jgi:hypothetical protein